MHEAPTPVSQSQPRVALPTEARIKQKEKLSADTEAGIKPRRVTKQIEDGNDDCGEDLKGLGCSSYYTDYPMEDPDSSGDDEDTFLTLPTVVPTDNYASVFSIVPTLCYGRHNRVDMLELCGGTGGISQLAFKRKLPSGGNLDKRTHVNLDDPKVQEAVIHYLHTCFVGVVILQPNCRTTGPLSHFNAQVNYETWNAHHQEDLPHIKFCGKVALLQDDLHRFFLREQPRGTWIDEIPPWSTLAERKVTCKAIMDQCCTGLCDW